MQKSMYFEKRSPLKSFLQVPLETYEAWKVDSTEAERNILEFNRKRHLEMPVKGKLIAEQLRNMAVKWKPLNDEKLKLDNAKKLFVKAQTKLHSDENNLMDMEEMKQILEKEMDLELQFKKLREWIPNPGQTIAPIIKPGMLM